MLKRIEFGRTLVFEFGVEPIALQYLPNAAQKSLARPAVEQSMIYTTTQRHDWAHDGLTCNCHDGITNPSGA
jgi:hypothetical protein